MTIEISKIKDGKISAFLGKIDGNGNGVVDARELSSGVAALKKNEALRVDAVAAFGTAPTSVTQLENFVAKPPKDEALKRILSADIVGVVEMRAVGRGNGDILGSDDKKQQIAIGVNGKITVGGHEPRTQKQLAHAIFSAAQLAGELRTRDLNGVTTRRLFATLSDALEVGVTGKTNVERQTIFAGAMTLLGSLVRNVRTTGPAGLAKAMTDRLLQALSRQKDVRFVRFYLNTLKLLEPKFDSVQRAAYNMLVERAYPSRFDIDAVTNNRKKTLTIIHTIHPEFWSEGDFYKHDTEFQKFTPIASKSSAKHLEYSGEIKDPSGKKEPLKVHVVLRKGEFNFLDGTNKGPGGVVVYSGHSSLGGNGSEAVRSSPAMQGSWYALFQNCIGMQNYPELMSKNPNGHFTLTKASTYGDSEGQRLRGALEMLARGENYAWARAEFAKIKILDEAGDNYLWPDQENVLSYYGQTDNDAKIDQGPLGVDPLFDVVKQRRFDDVIRAVGWLNSELYWNHAVEVEEGRKPNFGPEFFGSVVLDGVIPDPKPGERFRTRRVVAEGADGKRHTFYPVQFNPAYLHADRDETVGTTASDVLMQVNKLARGKLTTFEALRAVFMGVQGVYYESVYTSETPGILARYLKSVGMPALDPKKLIALLDKVDSNGNDEDVEKFRALLEQETTFKFAEYKPQIGDPQAVA